MVYVLMFLLGSAILALTFTLTAFGLGLFWEAVRPSGPGDFQAFYLKFLIIASIDVLLAMVHFPKFIAFVVTCLAYQKLFSAGLVQALVIGSVGGSIGLLLFKGIFMILAGLGMKLS
ncbi:MAG: hypothetical protein V1918_02995 [Planctomycetota bacterium]